MFFRVSVPAIGTVFVESRDAASAAATAQQYLIRNRIVLDEGALVGAAVPAIAEQVGSNLLLNSAGMPVQPAVAERPQAAAGDPLPNDSEPAMNISSSGRNDLATENFTASLTRSFEPAANQLFRFDVPVIGDLFVLASNPGDAVLAGQTHIQPFRQSSGIPAGFQLGLPETLDIDDLPVDADQNFVIDSAGRTREDLLTGVVPESAPSETFTASSVPSNETPTFVGKVIGVNGIPRFFRVNAKDTSEARSILESRFGASASVEVVSTPQFLLETDANFLASVQASQLGDADAFARTLELVTASEATNDSGQTTGGNSGGSSENTAGSGQLPVDVQEFPFASFQNAVAGLGLDPEGALGSTVSRQFDTLAPVARIGSLTGTVDPIGQQPGSLESFFRDQFGNLGIAAQTFRDLISGETSGDLNADQLLAFSALSKPDISTSRGRGAAGDVFRLARAAAEDRFGSFVASQLLPSNQRLFRELERQLAEGLPTTDFLQFARGQNLLPV